MDSKRYSEQDRELSAQHERVMMKAKIVFGSRENALSAHACAENELDFQPMVGSLLRRKGSIYDEISLSRTTLTVSCCRPSMNYHSSVSQIEVEALSRRCLSIADQIVGGGLSAPDERLDIRLVTSDLRRDLRRSGCNSSLRRFGRNLSRCYRPRDRTGISLRRLSRSAAQRNARLSPTAKK